MPATFRITLAHKPNTEGLFDVRLRITAARATAYAGLQISVAAKHWNENGKLENENWVKSGNRLSAQHNQDLVQALLDAKLLGRLYPNATAQELKALFVRRHEPVANTPASPDFVAFMRQSLELVDKPGFTVGTYELRATVINKFAEWRPTVTMKELTPQLMADYETHLQKELGNGPTTRRKNLKVLALYIKRAIRARLLSRDDDPLEDYPMPKATPKRVWLSEEELQAYEQVVLTPMQHLARLTYLTCFYLHGSRIGAVLRLRWRDRQFGRVVFSMDKGGIEKSVPESPQLTAILDSLRPEEGVDSDAYIFSWLDANYDQLDARTQLQAIKQATAKVNKNIFLGAKKAGITKRFSTHSSRRTMATKADRANKGDLGKVSGILGHKQRSTTEIYLDRYNSAEVDEAANNVYQDRPLPLLKAG